MSAHVTLQVTVVQAACVFHGPKDRSGSCAPCPRLNTLDSMVLPRIDLRSRRITTQIQGRMCNVYSSVQDDYQLLCLHPKTKNHLTICLLLRLTSQRTEDCHRKIVWIQMRELICEEVMPNSAIRLVAALQ
mmetsp:Transcript_85301/g.204341  ORF Transcript_85301/g.204341 Transcript_85301/m.204341 type:complete len:131 (+) Transcript_85301:269-661(+)